MLLQPRLESIEPTLPANVCRMNATEQRSGLRLSFKSARVFALLGLSLVFAGCNSRPRVTPSESLSAAAEPAELEQLNVLLGTWDGVAHITVLESGDTFKARSVREVHWEAGGQFLMERTVTRVEGGQPTTSVSLWTWDDSLGAFRSWRFDSHGTLHERILHWNEDEAFWQMEMTSQQRGESEPSLAEGVMRFISEDEKSYEWTRFKPGASEPWIKVKGQSKRVPPE